MFFLIPFAIFLLSTLLAAGIIARKFVYLKKLTPEAVGGSEEGFLSEFLPELSGKIKEIKLREYQVKFLAEFEKFLRKLRLVSLKIDTLTNRLIHHVRKTTAAHEEILNTESLAKEAEVPTLGKKDLKEEEQRLIIEIAKTPKNPELYKELGNLYMKTGDNLDAMEAFKKVFELDPQDIESRSKLDKVLARLYKSGELLPPKPKEK